MSRRRWRTASLVFLLVAALSLVYIGFHGGVANGFVPAQWIGFLILAFWLAGLLGVNIWYGGPLDPQRDQPTVPNDRLRTYRCGFCGSAGQFNPDNPPLDASCPRCGTLL